jgi:uncharacterized protein
VIMKTAIILHGMPSKEEYYNPESKAQSNKHWIPWIQQKLILQDVLAQTPELPEPFEPVYEKWKAVFDQFDVDEETTLVGHSCGAGFLVRWLTETDKKVGKVALVAPFLDPKGNEVASDFFKFEVGEDIASKTAGLKIFYSTDDYPVIIESVNMLKELPDVEETVLNGMGHLTFSGMGTEEFPELIKWLTD